MKRILCLFMLGSLFSCSALKNNKSTTETSPPATQMPPEKYPGQNTSPKNVTIYRDTLKSIPFLEHFGSASYMLLESLNGFIVFKGDTNQVTEMHKIIDASSVIGKKNSVALLLIDIPVFTRFTQAELDQIDSLYREKVKDISEYRLFHLSSFEKVKTE